MANDKIKFQTPFLTAKYPHISEPDTVGKFADGKYKTKLTGNTNDPEVRKFIQQIDAALAKSFTGKGLHVPYEVDEDTGEVTFGTFKTAYAPTVFDSRGNQIKASTKVGAGSVIRLLGNFIPFESGRNKGISVNFSQVQVKSLNNGASCAFGAVDDGYEYDGDDDVSDVAPTSGFTSNDSSDGNSALDI